MKQTKLALSAIMIVAVGLIGTNFITGSEMIEQEKFAIASSNPIYGHITIVHSDINGNILSYIQTDNIVAAIGKDCLSELVFGDLLTECTAGTNNVFNEIALFNGETFPITTNATALLIVDLENTGLAITGGTVSVNANATTGASPVGSKTDIANTFTAGSGVTQAVDGAALFNSSKDAVLAAQTFTSVTLNESDTLAITWTITLG